MSAQDKFDQEYLDDLERLRHERDEARLRRILNEIDRLTKERNGHLEGIRNLFKNKK